jgi:hypothetical protein
MEVMAADEKYAVKLVKTMYSDTEEGDLPVVFLSTDSMLYSMIAYFVALHNLGTTFQRVFQLQNLCNATVYF